MWTRDEFKCFGVQRKYVVEFPVVWRTKLMNILIENVWI